MKALKEVAKNEPTEFITETGKPATYKRRRKLVVQDEAGEWKRKNPPRKKEK
jgi:hypothetical protein